MDDWRINEKYRKPRKAKGTPFYTQRNYYALGVLAVSAVSWFLYELFPATRKLKHDQLENDKFKIPEGLELKIKQIQISHRDPTLNQLVTKIRDKEAEKYEEKSKPQSWLSKILTSTPDV